MKQLKLISISLFILLTFCINSCTEATVEPDTSSNPKNLLMNKMWIFKSSTNGSVAKTTKIIFQSEGIVHTFIHGKWEINAWDLTKNNDSMITHLTNYVGNPSDTALIKDLTNNKFTIVGNNIEYTYELAPSNPTYIYNISGQIINPDNKPIPANSKLYAVWRVDGNQGDFWAIWGEGTINRANNTFEFKLKTLPPLSVISIENNVSKFALANILLFNSDQLKEGIIPNNISLGDFVIGGIEDRAIIFTQNWKDTSSWIYKFKYGYGWAKGVYNNGQILDEWESIVTPNDGIFEIKGATLLIPAGNTQLKFPNWS